MVDADIDPTMAENLVLEDHLVKINAFFMDNQNRACVEAIQKLQNSVEAGKVTLKTGAPVAKDTAEYKDFMAGELATYQLWGHETSENFYDALEQKEQMEEFSHKTLVDNDAKIFYKCDDKNFQSIMELTFPSDMVTMAGMFFEQDLITKWMEAGPNTDLKFEIIKSPTPLCSAYSMSMPMGMPGMADRFMKTVGITYLDRKTNGILNVTKSFDKGVDTFFGEKLPAMPEGQVEMEIKQMFRYFEKIDEKSCKHVIISDIPLTGEMSKEVIIEHVIKTKTVERCSKLKETYAKVIPFYEERVQVSKKAFYDNIKKIFEDDE
jgi:hypothetical protein